MEGERGGGDLKNTNYLIAEGLNGRVRTSTVERTCFQPITSNEHTPLALKHHSRMVSAVLALDGFDLVIRLTKIRTGFEDLISRL